VDETAEEGPEPLRVGFQGREIVLPGTGLVGQEDDFRVTEVSDCRQMLPDARVVEELARRGIDRRIDVDPDQDGVAREVKIVHREEFPGHRCATECRR